MILTGDTAADHADRHGHCSPQLHAFSIQRSVFCDRPCSDSQDEPEDGLQGEDERQGSFTPQFLPYHAENVQITPPMPLSNVQMLYSSHQPSNSNEQDFPGYYHGPNGAHQTTWMKPPVSRMHYKIWSGTPSSSVMSSPDPQNYSTYLGASEDAQERSNQISHLTEFVDQLGSRYQGDPQSQQILRHSAASLGSPLLMSHETTPEPTKEYVLKTSVISPDSEEVDKIYTRGEALPELSHSFTDHEQQYAPMSISQVSPKSVDYATAHRAATSHRETKKSKMTPTARRMRPYLHSRWPTEMISKMRSPSHSGYSVLSTRPKLTKNETGDDYIDGGFPSMGTNSSADHQQGEWDYGKRHPAKHTVPLYTNENEVGSTASYPIPGPVSPRTRSDDSDMYLTMNTVKRDPNNTETSSIPNFDGAIPNRLDAICDLTNDTARPRRLPTAATAYTDGHNMNRNHLKLSQCRQYSASSEDLSSSRGCSEQFAPLSLSDTDPEPKRHPHGVLRRTSSSSEVAKGRWTQEEDDMLVALVQLARNECGYNYAAFMSEDSDGGADKSSGMSSIDWSAIAAKLPRPRTRAQVIAHYTEKFDPRLRKGRWTKEEDELLRSAVLQHKFSWINVSRDMNGTRSQRQCRTRWQQLTSHTLDFAGVQDPKQDYDSVRESISPD